jgi:hypothetical protein
MKRTTKIITGIILSIFVLSLTAIIGFSFTDRKNDHRSEHSTIAIPPSPQTGIDTAPYRVIVLEREQQEQEQDKEGIYRFFTGENCELSLHPVTTETERNKLFIPEALREFIATKTHHDTLTITVKMEELYKKYKKDEHAFVTLTGVNLHLHTSRVDIINKLYEIPTFVRNIETDTIRANSNGLLHIESCTVRVIEPLKAPSFKINDCKINELYIDLDRVDNWNVENCQIETENLTGSKNHIITLTKNETKTTNWLPKNKEARLNIALPGDTTQFVFY